MQRKTVLAVLIILAMAAPALAHPPTKIDISYDPAQKVLTAVITHPVQDPTTHYIGKVDVSLNDKEVASQQFMRQDDQNTQTVKYRLPDAKPGDKIGIEAYCNIFGKLEQEIKAQ